MTPPDGHWHRRTDKPVTVVDRIKTYGCQVKDCGWQVAVHPDKREVRGAPPV
jgi:hypothetical protein